MRLARTIIRAAASIACAFQSACGYGAGESGAGAVLRIEASRESKIPTNAFFNEANIAAFERTNPGVRVEVVLHQDSQTLNEFRAALAAGTPPDILVYSKVSAENELDAARTMVDLSAQPFVARIAKPDRLKSADGKIYVYQRAVDEGGMGVVFNAGLFSDLGLAPPSTYSEFLAVCEAVKASGRVPIFGPFKETWTFQIWTTSAWGSFAERGRPGLWDQLHSGAVRWTEVPEFEATLERGLQLATRGFFQPGFLLDEYPSAAEALRSGRCAMLFMTHSILKEMAETDPDLRLGMFPIPAFDDPELNLISQGQLGGAFVPRDARNGKLALSFFEFLSRPEQVARDIADPVMAYSPNLIDAPAGYRRHPALESLFREYIEPGKISTEMNAYVRVGVTDLWLYFQDMLAGLKTPREVLEAWDHRFRALMRQKGAPGF